MNSGIRHAEPVTPSMTPRTTVDGGHAPTVPQAAGRADPRKPAAKSPRRRAREFALQGLYEWLLSGSEAGVIDAHMREEDAFDRCDASHFDALLHGCIRDAAMLDQILTRHVDRKTSALSPVEHGALMIGAWELAHLVEVPYRVAINEAVELAKVFGGTDGHKYVNGVLDRVAKDLRPAEVADARAARTDRATRGPTSPSDTPHGAPSRHRG
jgi:N utilization substance protein B